MAASRVITVVGTDFEQLRRLAHFFVLRGEIGPRRIAGQRLDAANAGGDRGLGDDLEQTDIAGAANMRAAAKLDGIGAVGLGALVGHAHGDDADLVAIFLAEQRQRALRDGLIRRHQMGLHRLVLQDHRVDEILDRDDLFVGHGFLMREVESEPARLDQRALLRHVRSQHFAERFVQEVGRGMVRAGRGAAPMIDIEIDRVADFQRARLDDAMMQEEAVQLFLRVLDLEGRFGTGDAAAIADLAAGLAIEGRLVDDDDAVRALAELIDAGAVLDQRHDLAGRGFRVIAEELGRAQFLFQLEPERVGRGLAGASPGFPCLGTLALHRSGEAFGIDEDAASLSGRPR